MKFNKKKVLTVSGIVLGAIVVLLVVLYFSLSLVLKHSIQTVGSMVTGVPVTVKSIVVNPFGGSLSIRDLVVGNPDGYSTPHAFKLGEFDVALVPSSLFADKIVVDNLNIKAVELYMETDLLMKSNLSEIQDNVNRLVPQKKDGKEPEKPAEPEKKEEKQAKPLQVNKIDISDIKVYTVIKGTGKAAVPLMTPPIHLQDLGTEPEGIQPVEVINKILTSLFTSVFDAVKKGGLSAGKFLGDGANSAGKAIGDGASQLGSMFGLGGDKKAEAKK